MKNLENQLKHFLKRKCKVNLSLIVTFLITGQIGYSLIEDKSSHLGDIVNNDTIIEISDGSNNSGNGINSYIENGNSNIGNIYNYGTISGNASNLDELGFSGNGINNYSENSNSSIGNISNYGTISGNLTNLKGSYYSGNGISVTNWNKNSIGDISNYGIISGTIVNSNPLSSSLSSGNGISQNSSDSSLGTINNFGVISGNSNIERIEEEHYLQDLGNGISLKNVFVGDSDEKIISIGDINNSGVISGYSKDSTFISGNALGIVNQYYELSSRSSIIGNISNSGVISGYSKESNHISGNAIGSSILISANILTFNLVKNITAVSSIGDIDNLGVISSYSDKSGVNSGNAIASYSSIDNFFGNAISRIGNIDNLGIISAVSNSNDSNSGNAIASFTEGVNGKRESSIGKINNDGVISAYSKNSNSGFAIISNVNGLDNSPKNSIENINNSGVIKGSSAAIFIDIGNTNSNAFLNNYGILGGTRQPQFNFDDKNFNKYGLEVIFTLNENKDSINSLLIENGSGGKVTLENGEEKLVLNGTGDGKISKGIETLENDSYILASNLLDSENLIINGAGLEKGALIVDKDVNINNSIINGYGTALYLQEGNKFNSTNTIFNGGGLKNETPVIVGDEGNNIISISGNSAINGDVDLGEGDDNLSLSTSTMINGDLFGGAGNDTLALGDKISSKSSPNLNIFHDISGFENINTNGEITLFETAKITDASNINLENGSLTLRVDSNKKDENGNIIGHALYENSGVISSTGGNLVLGINGLGENTIISMGDTSIDESMNTNYDNTDKLLVTNSIVLDANLVEGTNGKEVEITVNNRLPVDPLSMGDELYSHLNKSYKSIISSGEIGKLANTTLVDRVQKETLVKIGTETGKTYDDAMAGLLGILDQIYANNPYAYTLKSSRDSLKLFEDNMSYLTIKPKENQWIVQGKGIYTGVKNDNKASGRELYGFDTGHRNYETITNTVGGLVTFEYGLSEKSSLGFVLGGNNQDINFKGANSIDGNSFYLGTFIKTETNQFKFTTGLGYQYTNNDVERNVFNKYDSFKTDEKYSINSLNAFVEGKYSVNIDNQWIMEPKVKLSYYFVNQDAIDEGYSNDQLSIGVDKFASNTGDLEIGLDFKKELLYSKGKLNNIFSFGVINTIGDKERDLKGHILGKDINGSKFNIQGVKLPTTSGKVAYNLELEKTNGMIYSAAVNFEFAEDNNRNVNATLGFGYKF